MQGQPPFVQWGGQAGDVPVPGDYDGDGDTDIATYRSSEGVWYVKDQPPFVQSGGQAGDVPVPGDYDGRDAKKNTGHRHLPSEQTGPGTSSACRLSRAVGEDRQETSPSPATTTVTATWTSRPEYKSEGVWYIKGQPPFVQWGGVAGDVPVPGDYDGRWRHRSRHLSSRATASGMSRIRLPFRAVGRTIRRHPGSRRLRRRRRHGSRDLPSERRSLVREGPAALRAVGRQCRRRPARPSAGHSTELVPLDTEDAPATSPDPASGTGMTTVETAIPASGPPPRWLPGERSPTSMATAILTSPSTAERGRRVRQGSTVSGITSVV